MKRKKRASLTNDTGEGYSSSSVYTSSDMLVTSYCVKKLREHTEQELIQQQERTNEFVEIMIHNLLPFLNDSMTLFGFITTSKHSLQALRYNHTWRAICVCSFNAYRFFPSLQDTSQHNLYWRDVVYRTLVELEDSVYAHMFYQCVDLKQSLIDPFKNQIRGQSRDQIIRGKRHQVHNYDVAGVQLSDNGIDLRNAVLLDWICVWNDHWRSHKSCHEFLKSVLFNQSTHPQFSLISSSGAKQSVTYNSEHYLLMHLDRFDQLEFFTAPFREHMKHILLNNFSLLTFEMKKYDYANSSTIWVSQFQFHILGCNNSMNLFTTYFSYNSSNNTTTLSINNVKDVVELTDSLCEILKNIFLIQFSQEAAPDLYYDNNSYCSQSMSQSSNYSGGAMSDDECNEDDLIIPGIISLERIVSPELFTFMNTRSEVYSYIYESLYYLISCICLNIANRYVSIVTPNLSHQQNHILQQINDKYGLFNR